MVFHLNIKRDVAWLTFKL
ncbi:hypothetical protein R3I94_006490 [Phoxinus phoxinus]|uniref:Uncharacterized protein n=1 Tax=Phoxinus phoxinus TaxID=58324 RepID=A0AAN9DEV8_9TELE